MRFTAMRWDFNIIVITIPIFTGPQTYDDSVRYIEEKFEALNANPEKTIYIHQTCATDTNQVQMILDSVIDMIIQANLQGCGLYWFFENSRKKSKSEIIQIWL